jgi:hypothetical protein
MSTDDKQEQLRESLRELHGTLEQTQPASEEAQQRIEGLKQGVAGVLDQPWEAHEHHFDSLREELGHAVDHFEMDHPELTLAIGRVLDNLAAIGL